VNLFPVFEDGDALGNFDSTSTNGSAGETMFAVRDAEEGAARSRMSGGGSGRPALPSNHAPTVSAMIAANGIKTVALLNRVAHFWQNRRLVHTYQRFLCIRSPQSRQKFGRYIATFM